MPENVAEAKAEMPERTGQKMGDTNKIRFPEQWRTENSQEKFRELILWLCARSETDEYFGATKLNKLLFFIDLEAMKTTGKTITNQRYQKLQQGPCPRALVPVLKELENAREVVTRMGQVGPFPQRKTFALREPDMGVFSADELVIMEKCLKKFWRKTARHVSMKSHDFLGWRIAEFCDDIPLGSIFISDRKLTAAEIEYGAKLAGSLSGERRHG